MIEAAKMSSTIEYATMFVSPNLIMQDLRKKNRWRRRMTPENRAEMELMVQQCPALYLCIEQMSTLQKFIMSSLRDCSVDSNCQH